MPVRSLQVDHMCTHGIPGRQVIDGTESSLLAVATNRNIFYGVSGNLKVISRLQKGERLTADMLQSVQISIEVLKLLPHEQTLELDRRVHNTDQFMDENVNRAVSNEELAKQVHMAPNSFARFFREQTGHAPQQYFLRKKVERACMMLQYLDAGIDDIAERLGFCDRYYFTKVFKKQIGLGPAEYRKSALTAV